MVLVLQDNTRAAAKAQLTPLKCPDRKDFGSTYQQSFWGGKSTPLRALRRSATNRSRQAADRQPCCHGGHSSTLRAGWGTCGLPSWTGPEPPPHAAPMSTRRRAITLLPCLSGWRNSLAAAQPTDRN